MTFKLAPLFSETFYQKSAESGKEGVEQRQV